MNRLNYPTVKMVVMAAFLLLAIPASKAMAEVIVIANSEVSASSLDAASLKSIYLGKKALWDNNVKIALTMLKSGSVHESFLNRYVGKTTEQFNNHWNQILFTGAGTPPTPFNSEKELVDYVKKTKGAIGYIDSGTTHDGVKVLTVK